MNMWAAPGVRCVCINDDWDWSATFGAHSVPTRVPMINEVLTIREVVSNNGLRTGVGLFFWEIEKLQSDGPLSAEMVWGAHCFRPLIERETDISIFKEMLDPASSEVANA